jgi:pfkB family carbohydrate kinase
MQQYDVVGIGNAIVDIIGRCDEAFLTKHGCAKGSMQLVDAAAVAKLYGDMGPAVEISGGSGANTIVGVASFGGKGGFIGKTANDQFGEVFGHDIRTAGVTFKTPPAPKGSEPTGRCLVLVTPDGQRTMNTFLGVSPQLGGGEVDADLVASARIVYLEGYLFDRPEAKAAFRQAANIAAKAGRQVHRNSGGVRGEGGRHHRRRRPVCRRFPVRHRHRPRPGNVRSTRQPGGRRDHLPHRRATRDQTAGPGAGEGLAGVIRAQTGSHHHARYGHECPSRTGGASSC